jgi:hypothetical protein
MNSNDFEHDLTGQPIRPLPPHWRAEILRNASGQLENQAGRRITVAERPWWQDLLWPHPVAWACLACIWLIILGLQLNMPGPQPMAPIRSAKRDPMSNYLENQRLLSNLLAPEKDVAEPNPPMPPLPKRPKAQLESDRRLA